MSDLDERLKGIWLDFGQGMYVQDPDGQVFTPVRWEESPLIGDYVDRVKQAFIDVGWLTPEQKEQTQMLVDKIAQAAQDMAKLPVTVQVPGAMTGAEWFARFKDELGKSRMLDGTNRIDRNIGSWIDDAAKRATGIEE